MRTRSHRYAYPRHLPLGVLTVVVILAALGGYVWHKRCSATGVLNAFLRARSVGNTKSMYNMLSVRSRSLASQYARSLEDAEQPDQPSAGQVAQDAYEVRSVRQDGRNAEMTLTLRSSTSKPNASAASLHVYMVREKGAWRIDTVRTGESHQGKGAPLNLRHRARSVKGRQER